MTIFFGTAKLILIVFQSRPIAVNSLLNGLRQRLQVIHHQLGVRVIEEQAEIVNPNLIDKEVGIVGSDIIELGVDLGEWLGLWRVLDLVQVLFGFWEI